MTEAHQLREWLVNRLSEYLDLPAEEIDTHQAIATYGLGSISAVKLSGEIEKFTGRRLTPTLVWDFPTIEKIVEHVSTAGPHSQVA